MRDAMSGDTGSIFGTNAGETDDQEPLVLAYAAALRGSAEALGACLSAEALSQACAEPLPPAVAPENLARLRHWLVERYRQLLSATPASGAAEKKVQHSPTPPGTDLSAYQVAELYRFIIDHTESQLVDLDIAPAQRRRLRTALFRRTLQDLARQLTGGGAPEFDHEREAQKISLALRTAALRLRTVSAAEDFFGFVCDELVSATSHIRAAWYATAHAADKRLTFRHTAGDARAVPKEITFAGAESPWTALMQQRSLVLDSDAPDVPPWSQQLTNVSATGIFLLDGVDAEELNFCVIHADRERYFTEATLSALDTLTIFGHFLLDLKRQSERDVLTGLPNRAALSKYLDKAMARGLRHDRLVAVGVLDLDDFKPVNDTYGHAVGDALLQQLALRLCSVLRSTDFVARLGGDEFAIVLEDISTVDDMEVALFHAQVAITAPFRRICELPVKVHGSVGITIFPLDDSPADGLLRHADQALYEAKETKDRRTRFWHYWNTPHPHNRRGYSWNLKENAVAYFQPIVSLTTGRVVGVEALARLHNGSNLVLPGMFLPMLDKSDRREVTRLMLERGLETLGHLDREGFNLAVSVNVEADFLASDDCASCFEKTVTSTGIASKRVVLELLENGEFLASEGARDTMETLKSLGARIALDDIGSAYSSLLRLRALPIDEIKLDQSFVRDLAEHPSHLLFVMSMQALAQGLGVHLVVEGVETEQLLDAMIALGVDAVQGFAIARPMPADDLEVWLRSDRAGAFRHRERPRTLLGAYAAHLRQRSLMDLITREGTFTSALHEPHQCPLVQFLQAQGHTTHPLLDVHDQMVRIFRGRNHLNDLGDSAAEQELARLVAEAIALET